MKLNLMAPGAHRFAVSAFALAGCLAVPAGAAVTNLTGDHAVIPGNGGAGNLTVAGTFSVAGDSGVSGNSIVAGTFEAVGNGTFDSNVGIFGDLEVAGNLSTSGLLDFGFSTVNSSVAGGTLRYLGTSEHTAALDVTESAGSFLWRDNAGATPATKMKLGTDNSLSLYSGSTPTIALKGGSGQIHLSGTGSGVYAGGTSIFSLGSTGDVTWDRPLAITSTTAPMSSTTGALTVAGGIGVAKDSYFNGIKIGKGKNSRDNNTAVGEDTLFANSTGIQNTALGYCALYQNSSGSSNTALGVAAGYLNTTGLENTAVGRQALCVNDVGSYNVAVGKSSLHQGNGSYNVALGVESQRYSLTGYGNVSMGYQTLYNITSGYRNLSSGYRAMFSNNTGASNVALGSESLYANTSGSSNVAVGVGAGRYQANGSTALTDPENSVYIGSGARGYSNADSNSIVIGNTAIGEGANTTVIGNSSTTSTHLYGQTKADSLKVNGAADLNNQVVVEPAVAPATAVRAMRVLADGTILIKPSGDIPMTGFTTGATP